MYALPLPSNDSSCPMLAPVAEALWGRTELKLVISTHNPALMHDHMPSNIDCQTTFWHMRINRVRLYPCQLLNNRDHHLAGATPCRLEVKHQQIFCVCLHTCRHFLRQKAQQSRSLERFDHTNVSWVSTKYHNSSLEGRNKAMQENLWWTIREHGHMHPYRCHHQWRPMLPYVDDAIGHDDGQFQKAPVVYAQGHPELGQTFAIINQT